MADKPVLHKCTNHLGCLLGYHGDDIEILPGMEPVCPECGSALIPLKRLHHPLESYLINAAIIVITTLTIWLIWPKVISFWDRLSKDAHSDGHGVSPPTQASPRP